MKKYLSVLFSLLLSTRAFADVTAYLNTDQAGIDDIFELTVKTDGNVTGEPDLTPLKDNFDVISRSISHQSYIVGGKAQTSSAWKIGMKALKTGVITIPALSVGNQETAPLEITITDTPSSITRKEHRSKAQSPTPDYALEAYLDEKNTPFIGQQMRYIVTLTDDGTIERGEPSFEPTTDFIIKPLDDTKVTQKQDGKRQISFSFALFALKSGKLYLPTVYFKGYAYPKADADNFFGAGFFNIRMPSIFGVETPVNLAFKGREIEVKPVPDDYRGWWLPANDVRLKAKFVDLPANIIQGTPVVREITIEADGLTDSQLPELIFEDTPGLKIYPEKPVGQTQLENGRLTAFQKTLVTYIIEDSGLIILPEIKVPWYDLKTGKIREAVVAKEILKIKENTNLPNTSSALKDANLPNSLANKNSATSENPYIIAGIAFILGILAAYLIFKPKNKKENLQKAENVDYFKLIEKQKDIKKLRDDVILWGQNKFPFKHITNLKDLACILENTEFDKQVECLNAALYDEKNKSNFDIKHFIKVLKTASKTGKKSQKSDPLPPLYKI